MADNGSNTLTRREARALFSDEIGSSVEPDRLFRSYDDGAVFTPEDFTVREVEEMLRVDGKAKTLEQVLTLPLRGAVPSLEPSKDDNGEADWAWEMLHRPSNLGGMSTPFDLVLSQAVSAVLFKRAYFEKVFKIEEGRVVYDKIVMRPPAGCRVKWNKRHGSFEGFAQYVGNDHPGSDELGYVHIPAQRAFVFIHGQHRRPLEGISDLDTPFQVWQTKQKVRWLWLQFLENQTMPKAIAKNDTSDGGAVQEFAKKVATLKGGGVLGIGPEQSVDAFQSDGSGASEYQNAMRYLDSEMAGSVLAGFTDLTSSASEGRGSFALSKDSTNLFLRSRQAVLGELGTALMSFLLADPIRWNFGLRAPVPTFKFGPIVPEEAEAALKLLESLVSGNQISPLVPLEFVQMLVVKVAQLLGMDEAKVEEAVLKQIGNEADPVKRLARGADAAEQLVRETFREPMAA